jgi:ATP adenylyltransferase
VAAFEELNDEEMLDLMRLAQRCIAALRNVMKPHGFNLGLNLGKCAGAGILEHLHLHIVPRWEGDTNFMPVVASTNVVPEALRETAAKLRAELSRLN